MPFNVAFGISYAGVSILFGNRKVLSSRDFVRAPSTLRGTYNFQFRGNASHSRLKHFRVRCRASSGRSKSPAARSAIEEQPSSRIFSNVELDEKSGRFTRIRASDIGCAALVSGTMVGAGVLALPAVTAASGFVPSSAALIGVWAYMLGSALLISEVSVSVACSLGRPSGVSLLSLGRVTLGRFGGILTAGAYTILHYSILTAYTSQGGAVSHQLFTGISSMLTSLLEQLHFDTALEASTSSQQFSHWLFPTSFASLIALGQYKFPDEVVEGINNLLVIGVIGTFLYTISTLLPEVQQDILLQTIHWENVPATVPVLFVSCVYHNIVGNIVSRLEGDLERAKRVIISGSFVPLCMFLLYNGVILSSASMKSVPASIEGLHASGIALFSFFAIATSFIGFVQGLVDLWSDVRISILDQSPTEVQESLIWNYALTVFPPIVCSIMFKDVFLKALDVAGTYGIAVLFGIVPPAMAWTIRQKRKGFPRALGGGNFVLTLMFLVPVAMIVQQSINH